MQEDAGRRMLTHEQKMGAILLFVFALLAVGLGFLQLRNTIYGPFVIRPPEESVAGLFADDKTRLQQIDTDQDGLNDYEELEFYGTSPYIPDTDSDGVKDKQEVEAGNDPLCAAAEGCEETAGEDLGQIPAADALFGDQTDTVDILSTAAIATTGTAAAIPGVEDIANNPKMIRQMLLQTGRIAPAELEKIDDATLLSIMKELLKEQAPPGSEAGP